MFQKYHRWYFSIIERARTRTLDGISEKHHILPKCLGGSNESENLVKLTIKEHFICHLCLTKMTQGLDKAKMYYALKAFSMKKINSRSIELYRRAYMNEEWNEKRKQSIRNALSSPESRDRKRKAAKESLNRPEVKKKISENSKKYWLSSLGDEFRERQSTDKFRSKISETTKTAMANDEIRAKYLKNYHASQDLRTQKIKEAWKDPIKRQLRLERRRATLAAKVKQVFLENPVCESDIEQIFENS